MGDAFSLSPKTIEAVHQAPYLNKSKCQKPEEKLLCSTLFPLNLFLLTQKKTSKKMYELKRRNNKYRSHKRNCFLKWHSRVFSTPFDFLCFTLLMPWLKTKKLLLFYAAPRTGINLPPMGRERIDPEELRKPGWQNRSFFHYAWLYSFDLIIYVGIWRIDFSKKLYA